MVRPESSDGDFDAILAGNGFLGCGTGNAADHCPQHRAHHEAATASGLRCWQYHR